MATNRLLVPTKFSPPRVGSRHIARRQLLDALQRDRHCRLMLVTGSAGFGKTILVAQWRQELMKAGQRVVWLSLSQDERLLPNFGTHLVESLERLGVPLDHEVLLAGDVAASLDEAVAAIVEALTRVDDELYLILDDYHHVDDPLVHHLLQKLLDHGPGNFHLVVTSRAVPPLSLARLRVMGQVGEIECGDLPFDLAETRAFLEQNAGGLRFSTAEVGEIHGLTHGWPASLQLLTITLRSRPEGRATLHRLASQSANLQQYLAEDVLSRLPPELAAFMETVSICRRFNAALAETLTGDTQAAATLQSIEDENLLIMRAESEDRSPWYRFHPLLVEFLAVRLARRGTEAVNALHRRASLWFAEHGLVVEAIRHATLGQDVASAIAVIERSAPTAWRVSYLGPLHHVINNVAPESMVSHPRLLYLGALTLAITGRHARAATWLEQLRASDPANTRETASRVALASALGALQRDDTARALELLAPFEDGADSGGGATRSAFESHILGSTLAASLAAAGRYAEAHRVLDAHPMNPDDGDSVLLLAGCRPIVLLVEGRVAEAGQASTHTRTVAMYGSRSAWAGMSAAVLASVLYEQDRVEEAGELLANRLHGLGASSPEIMIRAMLCQVRLDLLQDSAEAALALLERQANFFRSIGLDRAVAYAGAEQARLLIAQGDRRAAVESIARLAPIAAAHARADGFRAEIPAIVALARARLELARDNHDDALREADTALEIAARLGRNSMRVVGELVAAMILHAGGRPTEALGRLARAVASAPGLGLVRTFLDEGEPLYPLLRALQDHPALDDDTREYAADLLRRFERHDRAPSRQDAGADPQVSLTPRELEMVGLIAAGMSNKRIAQTLNIRLETVKWNLKNVFVKLEVSSRYDAMMRARRLGLIK